LQKLIAAYLLVTGPVAAVAVLFPGLVILGFYLLIIPGVVLSFAPTAFFWGCVFGVCWFAVKARLGDTVGTVLIAGAVAVSFLFGVTLPFRAAGEALYRDTLQPDVIPANRIGMAGDVRVDLPRPRWDNVNKRDTPKKRGFACDNLCVALLFTPGVKSVTINRSSGSNDAQAFDPEAKTYWLVPKGQCVDGGLVPDLEGRAGLFRTTPAEGRALVARWEFWLNKDFCLQRSSPIGRHDILIRHRRESAPVKLVKGWSLVSRVALSDEIEMQDAGGAVLFRRFKLNVSIPTRWLWVRFEGGPTTGHFGWGRDILSNKPGFEGDHLLGDLETHTNTNGR
jgi:hypothetical protein